jgi:hypothetical protein
MHFPTWQLEGRARSDFRVYSKRLLMIYNLSTPSTCVSNSYTKVGPTTFGFCRKVEQGNAAMKMLICFPLHSSMCSFATISIRMRYMFKIQ